MPLAAKSISLTESVSLAIKIGAVLSNMVLGFLKALYTLCACYNAYFLKSHWKDTTTMHLCYKEGQQLSGFHCFIPVAGSHFIYSLTPKIWMPTTYPDVDFRD